MKINKKERIKLEGDRSWGQEMMDYLAKHKKLNKSN